MSHRAAGFTLIEVLVATVILAVLSVLAHRGVAETRLVVERTRESATRFREVQRAITLMVTDFRQLAPRPVRQPVGDGYRPAFVTDANTSELVEFSRGGWPNGYGAARGSIQRVVYVLEGDTLIRRHWPVTDPTLSTEPVSRELLKGIESVQLRFMDDDREWQEQWNPGRSDLRVRPMAIELTIRLRDYGELRRLVEVAG